MDDYEEKLSALIAKLNRELSSEMEEVAAKGTDAVFDYAANYVQKCDIISTLEDILDMEDPDIEPDIPIENIEYLLTGTPYTAFSEIIKHFTWYLDDDMWREHRVSVVWAIEQAFQDAGCKHNCEQ